MQKLILLLTMSKNRSKQIFAKTKRNQIFSTNLCYYLPHSGYQY